MDRQVTVESSIWIEILFPYSFYGDGETQNKWLKMKPWPVLVHKPLVFSSKNSKLLLVTKIKDEETWSDYGKTIPNHCWFENLILVKVKVPKLSIYLFLKWRRKWIIRNRDESKSYLFWDTDGTFRKFSGKFAVGIWNRKFKKKEEETSF